MSYWEADSREWEVVVLRLASIYIRCQCHVWARALTGLFFTRGGNTTGKRCKSKKLWRRNPDEGNNGGAIFGLTSKKNSGARLGPIPRFLLRRPRAISLASTADYALPTGVSLSTRSEVLWPRDKNSTDHLPLLGD